MTATYPLMRQATERGNNMLREEAIKKHRAMWNWIAERILNDERTRNIASLKESYIHTQGELTIEMCGRNNCYLCYYTDVNCSRCPLLWPSDAKEYQCEHGYIDKGLYFQCCNLYGSGNWKLQAQLAYEIANLPERKDVK